MYLTKGLGIIEKIIEFDYSIRILEKHKDFFETGGVDLDDLIEIQSAFESFRELRDYFIELLLKDFSHEDKAMIYETFKAQMSKNLQKSFKEILY